MSSSEFFFVGSPTRIEFETDAALAGATGLAVEARRPDGTEAQWAATLDGTGTLVYAPVVSQWTMEGDWRLQGRFTLPGMTDPNRTETITVRVRARYG